MHVYIAYIWLHFHWHRCRYTRNCLYTCSALITCIDLTSLHAVISILFEIDSFREQSSVLFEVLLHISYNFFVFPLHSFVKRYCRKFKTKHETKHFYVIHDVNTQTNDKLQYITVTHFYLHQATTKKLWLTVHLKVKGKTSFPLSGSATVKESLPRTALDVFPNEHFPLLVTLLWYSLRHSRKRVLHGVVHLDGGDGFETPPQQSPFARTPRGFDISRTCSSKTPDPCAHWKQKKTKIIGVFIRKIRSFVDRDDPHLLGTCAQKLYNNCKVMW